MDQLHAPATGEVDLSRTVRFCIPFQGSALRTSGRRSNTFAAWPAMRGIGAYYELHVTCRGRPDRVTGYMLNIASIDEAVRSDAIELIDAAVRRPDQDPGPVLQAVCNALNERLAGSVRAVTWQLTPHYSLTVKEPSMDRVVIRQQFSFSAAHRLHSPALSEEENRRTFGRCSGVHGHGHNYRLEVAVSTPPGGLDLITIERIVAETVVERFDHTNLNHTSEFSDRVASVEHIAMVCHDLLVEPIATAGGRLEHVTVWETDKTSCTFPAGID